MSSLVGLRHLKTQGISELKNRLLGITQTEMLREKRREIRYRLSVQQLWDQGKRSNIHIIEISEVERQKWEEHI